LQVFRRGQWRDVWLSMNVLSIGLILPPNESTEATRHFDHAFLRSLRSGRYRIIKDVTVDSEPQQRVQVAAEFEV